MFLFSENSGGMDGEPSAMAWLGSLKSIIVMSHYQRWILNYLFHLFNQESRTNQETYKKDELYFHW